MTADNPQDFDYERMAEPGDASTRRGYWSVAKGLQKVDGLETSEYLDEVAAKHVHGDYSIQEAGSVLRAYYTDKKERAEADEGRQQEADLVSCRIVELLGKRAFSHSPAILSTIHRELFQDLDSDTYRPGEYKTEALVKREFILNGDSVLYADPTLVEQSLEYLFKQEREAYYGSEFNSEQLERFARFIAQIWQVHPFVEGNTRTVAVFCALYLNYLGFDADNEPFEDHAAYFRNALVRANYRNAKAKILPDLQYLVRFFQNMLTGEVHELRSRDLMCQTLFDNPSLLRNVGPEHAIQ